MEIIIIYRFYDEINTDDKRPSNNQLDLIVDPKESETDNYLERILGFKSNSKPLRKIGFVSVGRIINFEESRNGLFGKYKITNINIEHIIKSKSIEIHIYTNLKKLE